VPVVRARQQVDTAPIPGVRKTAAATNLSTGVGVEAQRGETEATKALASGQKWAAAGNFANTGAQIAGHAYAQMVEAERRRADEVVDLSTSNALDDWGNKTLYDPETGALTKKGRDAQDLPNEIDAEFTKVTAEIEKGLSTDRQRQAFAAKKANYRKNLDGTIYRHVFREMEVYEGEEVKAFTANKANAAITNASDPRRVGIELADGEAALKKSLPRLGVGPEGVEQQVRAFKSGALEGVINRQLATGNAAAAAAYFEEAPPGTFDEKAATRITAALSVGKTRGQAQQKSDEILAQGGTLSEQREKARGIDDPEVRDSVMQRLEHESEVRAHQQRQANELMLKGVYDKVERTHNVDSIDPATWAQMTGGERSAVRGYTTSLAKGQPIETDQVVYYMLKEAATTDPTAFLQTNLLTFKNKLSDSDFQELTGLRGAIRTGNKGATKVLDDFRSETGVISNALTLAGLDPTPTSDAEKQRIAQFHGLVAAEVRRVQEVTGKKIQNEDLEPIVNRLLAIQITDKGWFYDSTRSLATATPADIPAPDMTQILDSLKRHGLPTDPQAALAIWLRSKAKAGK
jgi:hypothetical protein